MRLAGLASTLAIVCAAIACSSAPPDPPADLAAPPRKTTKGSEQTAPPPPPEADTPPGDAGASCATVAPNHRCGLAPQCGCATNETCDVTNESTGATSCVTGGAATLGRPCVETGDCVAGLTCAYGACRPYCGTPRTKCDAPGTELCVEVPDADGKPIPNLSICTVSCDPFDPKGVCGSNACHWFGSLYAPFKVSDCNYAGPQQLYQACDADGDCAAGLVCIDHPNQSYGRNCEKWCRIGTPGDCPKGFSCEDFFGADAPVIGGVKRGVCLDLP